MMRLQPPADSTVNETRTMSDDRFENLEQTQENFDTVSAPPDQVDLEQVYAKVRELANALEPLENGELISDIVENTVKLLRDRTNRGDIKLINNSFKELRYALKVFAPYREVHKVSIFGSARTPEAHSDYKQAAQFAREMADAGWMVITGAGGGIMAAGHGGAGADPSFGLSIRLPFEQKTNSFISDDPKLVNFKYFFTRKLMFVRSSHAIALFPGGFGTMDEGFEALTLIQTGKSAPVPIVLVDSPGSHYWSKWQEYVENHLLDSGLISKQDLRLYKITDSVSEAVREVTHFYNNYHSIRFARNELIIRLQRAPMAGDLQRLNEAYADINLGSPMRVTSALPVEKDEPSILHLPRLVFQFNRRDLGRLRMLIDDLNDLP